MKTAFMAGLFSVAAAGLNNTQTAHLDKYIRTKYTKGNPTRWRSVKQDLQTQSQKRRQNRTTNPAPTRRIPNAK